jgi:hypothetical protein
MLLHGMCVVLRKLPMQELPQWKETPRALRCFLGSGLGSPESAAHFQPSLSGLAGAWLQRRQYVQIFRIHEHTYTIPFFYFNLIFFFLLTHG